MATILVVDTVRSTEHIGHLDPDDALEALDIVRLHVQVAVEAAGGMLVHFQGDGGAAIFGWPHAYEDHADRACRAAWDIQRPDSAEPLKLFDTGKPVRFRTGLYSGLVGFRQLDMEGGATLDLVGGTVHFAAALEKIAKPGAILLSSGTAGMCRLPLRTRPVEAGNLPSGFEGEVLELLALPPPESAAALPEGFRSPMTGRLPQRAQINAAISFPGPAGASIAIIGEPGIGQEQAGLDHGDGRFQGPGA
ncbi:MAG: adenylate/guanylate cyclase domain-containing protein, partial [Rhodobacteraceae bacterium]|nr:adenylate/guanylate cyclase domain-containing protein [Paracoccaceae bacterium]